MNEHKHGWGWVGKSILGRQNSMDRPSLEKIKEGQYGQSIEIKRKSGTRWSCRRGEQRQDYGETFDIM